MSGLPAGGGYSAKADSACERKGSGIAVVLAGAGARGAYEAGALSVLLPALGPVQPSIYVGTSAGAINAAGFAAFSHLDPSEAAERVIKVWKSIRQGHIYRPFLATLLRNAGRACLGRQPLGLLDSVPLRRTLAEVVNWDQLARNVEFGTVKACCVVATEKSSHANHVFTAATPGFGLADPDRARQLAFLPTTLAPVHVLASSAIPGVFPAVALPRTRGPVDYYVDGGVRLNTPIKPALMLDADKLVIVATSPHDWPPIGPPRRRPPGFISGTVDLVRAIMDDRLVEDLKVLVRKNEKAQKAEDAGEAEPGKGGCPRVVPFVFVGPSRRTELGDLARDVLRSRGIWPPHTLARMASRSTDVCELASHVLFDRDFIDEAIEMGRRDAAKQVKGGTVSWPATFDEQA